MDVSMDNNFFLEEGRRGGTEKYQKITFFDAQFYGVF